MGKAKSILTVAIAVGLIACTPTFGERGKGRAETVDIGGFSAELVRMQVDGIHGQYLQMVLWLPPEYFIEAMLLRGTETRAQLEKEMEYMEPYISIMVQAGIEQPDYSTIYSSAAELKKRAYILLDKGQRVYPLEDIPPMLRATFDSAKLVFAADGQSGKNTHVLVFPGNFEGNPIVDISNRDVLRVNFEADEPFSEAMFEWRTPFNSLAGKSSCGRCGDSVSAQWSFCSWCGNRLVENN